MVGGLVQERVLPFEYKAMFSPSDVIEIFMRPANVMEYGAVMAKPPMSDYKHEYFEGIGTLESFLSDGARTFLDTTKFENVREKTLRYPGYIEKIQLLKDIGFFDDDAIEATTKVLAKNWKFNKSKDITVFRIVAFGIKDGHHQRLSCEFIDRYDEVKEIHSMARTTGYTATATARLILENKLHLVGLHKPEDLVDMGFLPDILDYLKDRNINIKFNLLGE
jgi:saccharopine dehydrogenase-like NADP-dependent oxidoreductase